MCRFRLRESSYLLNGSNRTSSIITESIEDNKFKLYSHIDNQNFKRDKQINNFENGSNRSTTVHKNDRVGYDGQEKVFSSEYAVIVFNTMLPLSIDCNKNAITNPTKKSYVHRSDFICKYCQEIFHSVI